jgi:GT2 family glycosyltransferase
MSPRFETRLDMVGADVSVIIPTRGRTDKLFVSLQRILECKPTPAEIIIHVDADDIETAVCVRSRFPRVRLIESNERVGPGGARNRLVQAARCPVVVSFDDDSYPLDADYFLRVEEMFVRFPEVAIVAAEIFHEHESINPRGTSAVWAADFVNCGCAYRRTAFLETTGYVPLEVAYGMEEVDLAIRLHDRRWRVLKTDLLRIFHATDRAHQASAVITRASISNVALVAFLRYPVTCWWIGIKQVVNRVIWLLRHNRRAGVFTGIVGIPAHLWRHRKHRAPIRATTLRSYLRLRRQPVHLQDFDETAPSPNVSPQT